MENGIPQEVQSFIAEHIQSIEQLEIMLLLNDFPSRAWTVEEVYEKIKSTPKSVETRLMELCLQGFAIRDAKTKTFQYHPKSDTMDTRVNSLKQAYREKRIKVIELIFSKPDDQARLLAEAFKLRKDKENG